MVATDRAIRRRDESVREEKSHMEIQEMKVNMNEEKHDSGVFRESCF